MTVTRQQSAVLSYSVSEVASAIRSILQGGQATYSYRNTHEANDRSSFSTIITPVCWPLLLSTKMMVNLDAAGSQTAVLVQTESQWFIAGDVFNFYGSYIRDFLTAIRSRLDQDICK